MSTKDILFLVFIFIYFSSYLFMNYFCFKQINNFLDLNLNKKRQILNIINFHIIGYIFIISIIKLHQNLNFNISLFYYFILTIIPLSYYILIKNETFKSVLKSFFIFYLIVFVLIISIINLYEILNFNILILTIIPLSYYLLIKNKKSSHFFETLNIILIYYILFVLLFFLFSWLFYTIIDIL